MPIYADEPLAEPSRCVIVVDRALPAGRAANAAAVVAFTLGKRHPEVAGSDLIAATSSSLAREIFSQSRQTEFTRDGLSMSVAGSCARFMWAMISSRPPLRGIAARPT